jgi:2-keto-4-pentenoate hydratase
MACEDGDEYAMEHTQVEALAQELMSAFETGQTVHALPSSREGFDIDAAYQVEAALKQLHERNGATAVGRKVGYANKAMWRVFKLQTLVWAHMYDDTVHYNEDNTATLALAHPHSLKVEPEIVFGMKNTITASDVSATAALESAEWLAIGFEIIDCPYATWKFQPSDFLAPFGLHAALVVGERVEVQPELIPQLLEELPRFKVRVSKNGDFVEEGSGKNSLGSPAVCLAELVTAILKRFPDEPLRAREVISSGTLTAGHLTDRGDSWSVEVDGLPLPPLKLRLE